LVAEAVCLCDISSGRLGFNAENIPASRSHPAMPVIASNSKSSGREYDFVASAGSFIDQEEV
jgi:hypothetical protein